MGLRDFMFSNPAQHGSNGGDTFGKAKKAKRGKARDAEADFNQAERNAERGRREHDTPRRGLFGRGR